MATRILNTILGRGGGGGGGSDGGPSSSAKTPATRQRKGTAQRRSILVGGVSAAAAAAAVVRPRPQQQQRIKQKRARPREARTSKERRELSEIAMRTELPGQFDDACDFEKFVDGCSAVVDYVDSAFASAAERPLPSGAFATPPDDDEEEEKLRDDMLGIVTAFNEYWMTHKEEMLSENDLAANDASTARMPTGLIAMTVVSLAEATAAALGAFPAYATVTALSFPSVARQLLAQTPKLIREYKLADLLRALDALCHAWQRIRVDADVLAYAKMLRLRFAILMRCATSTAANSDLSDAERKLMTDPATYKLDDGTAVELRLPSLEFREEITHRFRALADATWIYNQHGSPWTREELAARLRYAAEKRIRRARKSRSDPAPKRRRTDGRGGEAAANFGRKEDDEADAEVAMGPDRGAAEVAALLCAYATKDVGTGLVAEQYRGKYMDFMICPGDDGVFKTRNPNMQDSTKNVVKVCRGGKFFSAASEKAATPPHKVLAEAAARLAAEIGTGADVAMLRPDFRGAEPTEDRMNDRSRAGIHEEIAAIGAFDCLMKGRYNVAWRARFVVARPTYRTAKSLGFLDKGALPILLVSANAFEFLYEGRILRTSSVYEAMAWWLEALRLAHGGLLPANVALFKGIVAAKLEKMRGEGAEDQDSDGSDTEPDERNREIAEADARISARQQQNFQHPQDEEEDVNMEAATYEDGDEDRVLLLTEELKQKASHIDARDVCRVPVDGAKTVQFRGEHRKKCELLLDNIPAEASPTRVPTPAAKRIIVSF